MRFIIDGTKIVYGPVRETDPYKAAYSAYKLDDSGQMIFEYQAVPFGHWIGPNHRKTMKVGHYGKPESYYRRRNIPKASRA